MRPKDNAFIDSDGRIRIFHGVNVVVKQPPYLPITSYFDAQNSLCQQDIDDLSNWGFNFVRLYVAWPGVEPQDGQFDTDYINAIRSIVTQLGARGISVLLDLHQDAISRYDCGEGLPNWMVKPWLSGAQKFPKPLDFSVPTDPQTDEPLLSECVKHNFGTYYLTDSVMKTFQNLYDNKDGAQDRLVRFWQTIATAFRGDTNVIGYEILNEPWFGDVFGHPDLLIPGRADAVNLAPMYQRVATAIRKIDPDHLIFYEPVVGDTLFLGFLNGPGGHAYDDRNVLSYHIYCVDVDPQGSPRSVFVCKSTQDFVLQERVLQVRNVIGGGMFMTEMGAIGGAASAIDDVQWLLGEADRFLQSWAYWQFKWYGDFTTSSDPAVAESLYDEHGALDLAKLKALSRTYASAIAGTDPVMSFSNVTGTFKLTYTVGDSAAPTVIYLNAALWYPQGAAVDVSPAGSLDCSFAVNGFSVICRRRSAPLGSRVVIRVSAK